MYTINSLLTSGYSFTATPGLFSMFGANICFTKRQLKKTQNEANKPDQTNISAIKYQSLFASSVWKYLSPLSAFLSSLLHTDTEKQTLGKIFCSAGPEQLEGTDEEWSQVAQEWASAYRASLPRQPLQPGVWQIFCMCTAEWVCICKSLQWQLQKEFPLNISPAQIQLKHPHKGGISLFTVDMCLDVQRKWLIIM